MFSITAVASILKYEYDPRTCAVFFNVHVVLSWFFLRMDREKIRLLTFLTTHHTGRRTQQIKDTMQAYSFRSKRKEYGTKVLFYFKLVLKKKTSVVDCQDLKG